MSPRGRLLVVEDNDTLRRGVARALRELFDTVEEAERGELGVARIRGAEPFDVVLTDLRLPGCDGIEVLRAARERDPRTAVVLMTGYGSVENAVEAMRLGAFDFVQKPLDLEQLEVRVRRAREHAQLAGEVASLRRERRAALAGDGIVGESPGLRAAVELAERVAGSRATVLVCGESGTGKELIAGVVHSRSPRADGSFVKVNCAALPETLLESELFGHERGAFTGADRTRVGRFEQADGGTLFLDEIGDMSAATQAKLLRVLQDQEFYRLGGTRAIRTDVRIVAATNHDLESAIRDGRFREDLFFRLSVVPIHLPPLRERRDDVVLLARHFLAHFARELGRPRSGFSEAALERIREYGWPGNVRELRNVIERAVLLSDGERIGIAEIGLSGRAEGGLRGGLLRTLPPGSLDLARVEREAVLEALRRTGFVQKEAAGLLGISPRKLNYMIQRMGIQHASWRRNREAPSE
jgi:DNA-binding NtrC family response regulator